MTFDDVLRPVPSRAHRLRAAGLGCVAGVLLLLGAIASAHRALVITDSLADHARTTTMDAAPVVLWWALAGVLLWAALLFARSVLDLASNTQRAYDQSFRFAVASWPVRIAALLLALTAFGGVNSSVAQASPASAVSTSMTHNAPNFGSSTSLKTSKADTSAPEPGWTAPRPPADAAGSTDSASLVTGSAGSASATTVTVRRGDTLWSIVARHLGPGADARLIAETWPQWFQTNRAAIGDDPDVLFAGQQLRIPSPHDTTSSTTPVPAFDGSPR